MTPGERRVLRMAASSGGVTKGWFDTYRGLRQIAKDLIWSGHLSVLGNKVILTQAGQEKLEADQ